MKVLRNFFDYPVVFFVYIRLVDLVATKLKRSSTFYNLCGYVACKEWVML